jgi:hypothetical protein
MLMPTQRREVKQIGLMLASIMNESNFAFQTFQIFGIRIVMTAPSIARRFGGRNWIGRLRILRGFLQWSTRHGESLQRNEWLNLKSVEHKIKTLADAHRPQPAQEFRPGFGVVAVTPETANI